MLDCSYTKITHLSDLPSSLTEFIISETQITELPELPLNLDTFEAYNTPLATPICENVTAQQYAKRWNTLLS